MTKLVKHVPVRRGLDTVWLRPGDDLPEWAEGMVGAHALADDDSVTDSPAEPKVVAEHPKRASKTKDPSTPDFTSAAPRRRSRE